MKVTKDLKLIISGGIRDLFDNHFKSAFNLTDDEYNYFAEHLTSEEFDILINENPTFSHKRGMIKIRNKYLEAYGK